MTRSVRMYNPTHRFDSTSQSGISGNPSLAWSHEVDPELQFDPDEESDINLNREVHNDIKTVAVWNNTVYYTTRGGEVTALETDGSHRWTVDQKWEVNSMPTVVNDMVYVGLEEITALDATSGNIQWTKEHKASQSSPAIVDDAVYFVSGGTLYVLNAKDGSEQWKFKIEDKITTSPAVVNGTVYVGSGDSVYAIDTNSESVCWKFEPDNEAGSSSNIFGEKGEFRSSPTVVDETVFLGSTDGTFYAINANQGSQRWAINTDRDIHSSPAVVDSTVYFSSTDNSVYAIDTENGDKKWTSDIDFSGFSSPTVVDETLYIGGTSISALDVDTGSTKWEVEIESNGPSPMKQLTSPIVVSEGRLYIGSEDGVLYAITGE